jgi:hypothetical protein
MRWLLLVLTASMLALLPWRVLGFAARFNRLPLELRDGQAALAAILIAIDQDGYR